MKLSPECRQESSDSVKLANSFIPFSEWKRYENRGRSERRALRRGKSIKQNVIKLEESQE